MSCESVYSCTLHTYYTKIISLRSCNYNIRVGLRDLVSGVVLAMVDSAGSGIKGFKEVGSSISRNLKIKSFTRGDGNCFRDSRAGPCLKGIGRASSSLVRAPAHVRMALKQGLHNAPRIWGDHTVRPLDNIHDFPSGLKACGKVCTLACQL